MRKLLPIALLLIASTALAHAGHQHQFLGVVKSVSADRVTITTKAGEKTFDVTNKTQFLREGKAASRRDLVTGARVSVHVLDDGRTADSIRFGPR